MGNAHRDFRPGNRRRTDPVLQTQTAQTYLQPAYAGHVYYLFTGVSVMREIRTVQRIFRRNRPVRADTGKWIAFLAVLGLLTGNLILPVRAEEHAENLRGYEAGETAVSGTDEDSITQSAENGGVHVRKTLRDNGDGTYQIELESWVTGGTKTEQVPTDVVLLMDTSGSMRLPCPGAADRLAALKTAACAFVDSIQEQNAGTDPSGQSRIALIQYSSAANTGIRRHLTCADAEGAASLKTAIRSFEKGGRTRMDLGMELAEEIMNTESDAGRSRAVVLFTDGVPANEDYDGFVMVTANRTLAAAKRLKENGIEVFGLSIEQYAKCTPGEAMPVYTPHSAANYIAPYYGIGGVNTSNENAIALENRLMYLVTSANPHAQDMDTPNAEDPSDPGKTTGQKRETYYFTAQTSDELSSVFRNLASQVGTADRSLGRDAQARDDILWPFRRTEGTLVRAYESAYLGNEGWAERREITDQLFVQDTEGSVKAQGFDYAGNYVSEEPHPGEASGEEPFRGSKLILSFSIRPQAIFGGNQIPTNSELSGIYADEAAEEAEVRYPVPKADLKLRYAIGMTDRRVYVPDPANLETLVLFPEDFRADGSRNAYVDIRYEMTDENGGTAGTLEIPVGEKLENCSWQWTKETADRCGQYKLSCTVTPVKDGHFPEKELTRQGTVHIFHPEILFEDSTQYIGDPSDTVPGDSTEGGVLGEHLGRIRWICGDDTASISEEEPELGFRIAVPEGLRQENGRWVIAGKEDIPVIAGVYRTKEGQLGEDITGKTDFLHACERADCGYEEENRDRTGTRYLIHVLERPMQEKVCLPNTGGEGMLPYAGSAVLLAMMGAGISGYKGKDKSRNRKHKSSEWGK